MSEGDSSGGPLQGGFPRPPPLESDVEAQRQYHRVGARLFGGTAGPVLLGRWEVGELIDAGGMGLVYRAHDPRLRRAVAIKVMQLGFGADIERRRRRMLREAQAMAQVRHPNVIHVYDVEFSDDQVFVVMELVAGVHLASWLRSRERRWTEIVDVFLAAGEGLAASHAAGVIHRDFKPENVLVDAHGHVKVIDFGLASTARMDLAGGAPPAGAALTGDGAILGTLNYIAPEQLRGDLAETSALSDQYSFCRALFESLYQSRPFHGRTVEELLGAMEAEDLDFGRPPRRVPRRLRGILRRGLAAVPGRRFADMPTLLAELRASRRARGPWIVLAMLGAAGVAAGLAFSGDMSECDAIAAQQRRIWGDERTAAIAASVARVPVSRPQQAWTRIHHQMTEHVEAWTKSSLAACQVGPVGSCLVEHGVVLEAMSEALTRATPDLLGELDLMFLDLRERLERCAVDPGTRSSGVSTLHLRGRFARAWVEELSGRLMAAHAEALAASQEARALDDRALIAEADLRLGRVLGRMHDAAALEPLARAREGGMAARELLIVLDAGTFLTKFAVEVLEDPALAQRADELLEGTLEAVGSPPWRLAQLLDARGLVAQAQDRYAEAAALHGRAAELLASVLDATSPEVLRVELNRVNAVAQAPRSEAGQPRPEEMYRVLLARAVAALGPRHALTCLIRYNTALFLFAAGELNAAAAEAYPALSLAQAVYGDDGQVAAEIEVLVGQIAEAQGRLASATGHATKALARFEALERRDGRVYFASLAAVDLLANLALARGENLEAAALFDRGARMAARIGLRGPLQAMGFQNNAAYSRLEAGMPREALVQLNRLLTQIELHSLQRTPLGVQVRGNIGLALLATGESASAVAHLEAALQSVEALSAASPELIPLGPLYQAKISEARRRSGQR